MSDLLREIKSSLSKLATSPRKSFGQNFMIDEATLRSIAAALDIQKNESVLEIGPGLGFLTRELLSAGASVRAVEMDRKFAELLRHKFKDQAVEIIESDILEFTPDHSKIKVAGNIPYNITSPIIEWMITHRQKIQTAVLTVQWEVAQRLIAEPRTKEWGALSIFVQFYAHVEIVRKVAKHHFHPAPKVDSAVIKFTFLPSAKVAVSDEALFFKIVRKAFQKRRKTLLNALETEQLKKSQLGEIFKKINFDPQRRPETLSLEEWAMLSSEIASHCPSAA